MTDAEPDGGNSRRARVERIVSMRMGGLTIVLESIYDPANRAAVMRSAEAFGVAAVHVIDRDAAQKHRARKVSRSAERWLQIHDYPNTETALHLLREQGYLIYAADPHSDIALNDLPFDEKVALAFGNEHRGLSELLRSNADVRFRIPMRGFVESLNLSTAAAIALAVARGRRETALGAMTDLSAEDQSRLVRALLGDSDADQKH